MTLEEQIARLQQIEAVAKEHGAVAAVVFAPTCTSLEQALGTMTGAAPREVEDHGLTADDIRQKLTEATRGALGLEGRQELTDEQAAQVEQALRYGSFKVVEV